MDSSRFRGVRLASMANFENPCSSMATLRSQRFWGSSGPRRPAKESSWADCAGAEEAGKEWETGAKGPATFPCGFSF
eukprot:4443999-Pyramimonas_sp.AAC.1